MENQTKEQLIEQRREELLNLPIDESFKLPEGMYAPFGYDCLVKECGQEEVKTLAGIIISTGNRRTIGASIGIVYAIGELCSKPIKLGDKIYFNPGEQLCIYHLGTAYLQMNEASILGRVTPGTYLNTYVPDSHHIRREKRVKGMQDYQKGAEEKGNIETEKHDHKVKVRDHITKPTKTK